MKEISKDNWRVMFYFLIKDPEPVKSMNEIADYYSGNHIRLQGETYWRKTTNKIGKTNQNLYRPIIKQFIKEGVVEDIDKGYRLNKNLQYIKELLDFFGKIGKKALIDNENFIFDNITKQDFNSKLLLQEINLKVPELKEYFKKTGQAQTFWEDKENQEKASKVKNAVKELRKLFRAFEQK